MAESIYMTRFEQSRFVEAANGWIQTLEENADQGPEVSQKVETFIRENNRFGFVGRLQTLTVFSELEGAVRNPGPDLKSKLTRTRDGIAAMKSSFPRSAIAALTLLALGGAGAGLSIAGRMGKLNGIAASMRGQLTAIANSNAAGKLSQWIKAADPRKLFA